MGAGAEATSHAAPRSPALTPSAGAGAGAGAHNWHGADDHGAGGGAGGGAGDGGSSTPTARALSGLSMCDVTPRTGPGAYYGDSVDGNSVAGGASSAVSVAGSSMSGYTTGATTPLAQSGSGRSRHRHSRAKSSPAPRTPSPPRVVLRGIEPPTTPQRLALMGSVPTLKHSLPCDGESGVSPHTARVRERPEHSLPAPPGMVVDRYGFYVAKEEAEKTAKADRKQRLHDASRARKWRNMLDSWSWFVAKKSNKIKDRIRKGVPNQCRGQVWQVLCGSLQLQAKNKGTLCVFNMCAHMGCWALANVDTELVVPFPRRVPTAVGTSPQPLRKHHPS